MLYILCLVIVGLLIILGVNNKKFTKEIHLLREALRDSRMVNKINTDYIKTIDGYKEKYTILRSLCDKKP